MDIMIDPFPDLKSPVHTGKSVCVTATVQRDAIIRPIIEHIEERMHHAISEACTHGDASATVDFDLGVQLDGRALGYLIEVMRARFTLREYRYSADYGPSPGQSPRKDGRVALHLKITLTWIF
jgi:hypothetical protein